MKMCQCKDGNVSPIVGAKNEGEGGGEGGANGAERHRQKDGCLPATEIPIPIPNSWIAYLPWASATVPKMTPPMK